jgi:hypothetical protein
MSISWFCRCPRVERATHALRRASKGRGR